MKMTTKLAALGVASASLAVPAGTAFAQSAAEEGSRSLTVEDQRLSVEDLEDLTFMSGEEADRLGISAEIPETRPELPAGVVPPEYRTAKALAAATTPCPSGKQCMWTGGYFAGPGRWLNGGHSGTYWNWAETKCSGSGNPGGNWKNCASSLRNSTAAFGFTVFNNSGNEDAGSYKNVPATQQREQLGSFDNNIEKSVGFGI
jgi:hypothetical protein